MFFSLFMFIFSAPVHSRLIEIKCAAGPWCLFLITQIKTDDDLVRRVKNGANGPEKSETVIRTIVLGETVAQVIAHYFFFPPAAVNRNYIQFSAAPAPRSGAALKI